ncbi:outer membrane receptor for ferrienterochelin and colicins [Parabacteroides sp. PF5-5]|uniref:TonB-dependent receptor n=1 Tax=unclassified Parabacteroides TaxID=2649774 RepID=UPI002476238C|nr:MULTISPECIES: TonB-dependent receptor [unclassified Parabacteroides]MDH6305840.1 outer membrane receptor for ferrienterochelin and colicins [Parabacteroides sp. PH5-39]MDH6317346.1 outer membrane receptor for ferrienterochelin and colicins [Parabacteroides sp. PF5-13]MDH6320554.1 outer membrane receptor for ferrienterochelin and colicins [Parabacteroides sp. PH5-13]MDH6324283.1 outer membrane receptor for ferrienterochelin and colicins [Parabacteroides sp. PH5-8]MDH6328480.1 outer membrane 
MKRIISLALVLCCAFCIVKAEDIPNLNPSDANIVGHILDKKTGEHLSFMNVFLQGTTIGTSTDATGHYYLKNLPEGTFTLVMKSIGYKTIEKKVTLKKGKTLEINFDAEEDAVSLDGVVVSANRNETTRRMAPSLVNVLDSRTFETTSSTSLADGLNFQPGVRVENNCQNCGFQQVRINGLEGPYTQILMDSRPIFSALTGVYGLEQIPANMIERVEVMRGGGSALFGSSAIAGTINIITKEPLRNSAQIAHTLTMTGGDRPDNNTTFNASLVTDDHKAGIYIFGQNRYRAAYDHDGDGYTELGKLDAKTLGFRSYLKTSTYSKLIFEYHNITEFRRGGNLLNLPPHETNITEQTDHNINGGGLKFDLFSKNYKHRLNLYTSAQHTKRDSYYGADFDADAYGHTTDLTFVGGGQYSYAWDKCLFMPAEFTGGLEYNYDDLQDEMLGYKRTIEQTVHIESLFLQNEWKNKQWSFLIGGRLDKHNLIDGVIFSPRANLRFNPTDDINMRLSYSSGFRAPQAFDEDLHITAVGGDVVIINLDPDLKEESSQSLSASVDYYRRFGAVQTNFLLEGFYTDLRNVFILEEQGHDEKGNVLMERRNGKGARVMGINAEAKIAYAWMQLQAGATLQRSRYKEAEQWSENENIAPQKKMFRSPDVYGYFTSTFTPVKRFTASLTGTYTGSMLVQHMAGYIPEDREEKTPDFFDMSLKLAYDFPIYRSVTLQLNAGVKNIFDAYQDDFDKGPQRDAGYMYGPGIPRSYYIGCKISY